MSLVHFLTQLVYPERYGRDDAPSLVIPHQYGAFVGFDWDVYYKVRAFGRVTWTADTSSLHTLATCTSVNQEFLVSSVHASIAASRGKVALTHPTKWHCAPASTFHMPCLASLTHPHRNLARDPDMRGPRRS